MPTAFTRRSFVAGAALRWASVFAKSLRAADYTFIQFHNQTTTSSLHRQGWSLLEGTTGALA